MIYIMNKNTNKLLVDDYSFTNKKHKYYYVDDEELKSINSYRDHDARLVKSSKFLFGNKRLNKFIKTHSIPDAILIDK